MPKSIDINQRIPLEILHIALVAYLDESYSNEYILQQLKLEYTGENRLKKGLRIVNKIILKSPLKSIIDDNKEALLMALKRGNDRNIILIALLNAAFPFSFDVLSVFGKFFAVQDAINADTIKRAIANVYGGNRATENGIYSVVPMFLEAKFFNRPKQGLYTFDDKLQYSSPIALDIYKASFTSNKQQDTFQENQLMDPYFEFLDMF